MTFGLAVPSWRVTAAWELRYNQPQALWRCVGLHGVEWVIRGRCSHGKDTESQLSGSVGLADMVGIASGVVEG
jgi:hypothetical protein